MTNQEILQIAMEQSALDAGCQAEDFCQKENKVILSQKHDGARKNFGNLPLFCSLISYGNNVIASVDAQIADAVGAYINTVPFHRCFETPYMHRLTNILTSYNMEIGLTREGFLPDTDILRPLPCLYPIRLLNPPDFAHLYTTPWSNNALSKKFCHLDILAVGAYDGDRLIGLAGCSADCDTMWQIGIDVLPDYQRQGVAAALTSTLAWETLQRGKVPYYCCVWSNIPSARNAIRSGFRPAWIEVTARPKPIM